MAPAGAAPTPEALLEHAAFLRGLARSLLYDRGQAEDVVQETFLVALEREPCHHSRLRAWLAGIARNIALKSLRAERRRTARERLANRPDRITPPDGIASRLEMQRRLVDAVEALREPYRSTIVHRFFDDRTTAEIARLSGVPKKTVETRLRRALQHLRARLDADFGGQRRSWTMALLPLVHLSVPAKAAGASGAAAAITGVLAMSKKSVIIVVSVVLVGAFVAGWGYRAISEWRAEPGERVTTRGDRMHASARGPERSTPAAAPAKGALDQTAEPTGAADEAATSAEDANAANLASAPRFLFPGMESTLNALDWELIGEALSHLPPLLDELVTTVVNGEELPAKVGDIQRWNGPLLGQAIMLERLGVSGIGTNGRFSHPGLVANMIPITLEKMDRKLSKEQEDLLQEIGRRYIEEDRLRREAYGEGSLRLAQYIDETALKDRFYAEVNGMLTDAQAEALRPESVRGYSSVDMFSSAIQWGPAIRPFPLKSRDQLASRMTGLVLQHLGIDESMRESVHTLTTEWADRLPDSLLKSQSAAMARYNWHRVDRVRALAKEQVRLFDAMLQRLDLPPEIAAKIRNEVVVAVPCLTENNG